MSRDQIYSLPLNRVGDFEFDDAVADVFPDMIARSVPGYASILSMIQQLTSQFVQPNSHVYDLGCSLGAATFLIQNAAPVSAKIFAIDNSQAMITRLDERLAEQASKATQPKAAVVSRLDDICTTPMENASFVVLNLTLQFVPAEKRSALLQRAFDAMLPGGALLLSEKLYFEDQLQQDLLTRLHHQFKRSHGYSDLEIAQKRTAIENRLIPETMQTHVDRLHQVGFQTVAPWFQCFNFASILAVKSGDSANGNEVQS